MAVSAVSWASAIAVALLLAGCSSPRSGTSPSAGQAGAAASESPPALQVGDHWRHESSGGGATVTTDMTVKAIEDHAGASAYRLEGTVDSSAAGASTTASSTSWTRVSDQASMETQATAHLSYGGYSSDSTTTTVYDPPCASLHWPLAVGAAWTATCTATTTSSSGGGSHTATTTTNYTVEGKESVTVKAGTFDAFRLRVESGGQVQTEWVAAAACGMVKSVATSQGQTATTELTAYQC